MKFILFYHFDTFGCFMALTSSSVINGENLTRKYQDDDYGGGNIRDELQKVTDLGDIYMSVYIQAKLQNISPRKIRPKRKKQRNWEHG